MKILVLDVGGTFIKNAVMNERAEILQRGDKIPTPLSSRADFFSVIENIYTPVKNDVEGIALSLPGVIDAERGICISSGALGYNNDCNIVEELQKICPTKITVENDANCAAIAEAKIGSLADVEDGFVMIFGTSVGGAIIKNHELHRGKHNLSGEIAATLMNNTNFHFLGSVTALLTEYAQIKNLSIENVSGEEFFQAVAKKEKDALACFDKFTRYIAEHIFNIQILIDPEKVAIGGGISAQNIFIDSIRKQLDGIYKSCLDFPIKIPRLEIVPCKFRNDANLIGALYCWLER